MAYSSDSNWKTPKWQISNQNLEQTLRILRLTGAKSEITNVFKRAQWNRIMIYIWCRWKISGLIMIFKCHLQLIATSRIFALDSKGYNDMERFHLLLFSIKDSIFPIHMIGKFCYKQEERWVLTYFINRKFHVFNRKFHVLNRKFPFFNRKFHVFDNKFHVFDSKFRNLNSNSDAKYH